VQNIGGIAAFAEGDIIFDNITCDLEMKTYSYIPSNTNIMYYYGGLLGKYYLGDSKLSVTNCNIAPDISNIRMYQMAGGIVGYLQTEKGCGGRHECYSDRYNNWDSFDRR